MFFCRQIFLLVIYAATSFCLKVKVVEFNHFVKLIIWIKRWAFQGFQINERFIQKLSDLSFLTAYADGFICKKYYLCVSLFLGFLLQVACQVLFGNTASTSRRKTQWQGLIQSTGRQLYCWVQTIDHSYQKDVSTVYYWHRIKL